MLARRRAAVESCGSPETLGGLLPGEHTFRIRAIDLALNVDPTPATRTWTVDAAAGHDHHLRPGRAHRSTARLPSVPSTVESAIFVFPSDQPGSTFECALDGEDFLPCTSPRAYWVVEDGEHEFEVRATNPQLVVEEPPAVYEWLVALGPDTVPPQTTILTSPTTPETPPPPAAVDWNSVATFEFRGSDNRTPELDLTFECALDGTAYNSCTSPEQWSDLLPRHARPPRPRPRRRRQPRPDPGALRVGARRRRR